MNYYNITSVRLRNYIQDVQPINEKKKINKTRTKSTK